VRNAFVACALHCRPNMATAHSREGAHSTAIAHTTTPGATTHTVYYPRTSHLGLQPPSTKWRHVYTSGRCDGCPTSSVQILSCLGLQLPRELYLTYFPLNTRRISAAVMTLKRLLSERKSQRLCTLLPSNVLPSQHASQVQTTDR
jgi:hypothetical protein